MRRTTRREQFRDALLAPPVWQEGGSWAHYSEERMMLRVAMSSAPDVWRAFVVTSTVGCLLVVTVAGNERIILGTVAGYFGGLVDSM